MRTQWNDAYIKGYQAGYRDGLADGANGRKEEPGENEYANLPIEAMGLSTRAYNCLNRVGCGTVADVAALDGYRIATMRNLGPKTAAEIARWLCIHGFGDSAWGEY